MELRVDRFVVPLIESKMIKTILSYLRCFHRYAYSYRSFPVKLRSLDHNGQRRNRYAISDIQLYEKRI